MTVIPGHSSTFAARLLRIARFAPKPSPEIRRFPRGELGHYADLCSRILREARSLVAAGTFGPALSGLLARASDLLDDIDEFLVGMNPLHDAEAYLCAAELHRALEEIQARLPRRLRGRRVESSVNPR